MNALNDYLDRNPDPERDRRVAEFFADVDDSPEADPLDAIPVHSGWGGYSMPYRRSTATDADRRRAELEAREAVLRAWAKDPASYLWQADVITVKHVGEHPDLFQRDEAMAVARLRPVLAQWRVPRCEDGSVDMTAYAALLKVGGR